MSDQALKASWSYFRIFVGVVITIAAVYMLVTGQGDQTLIGKLFMLLWGLVSTGTGAVDVKAANGNGGSHPRIDYE